MTLAIDERLAAANLKIAALALALAKARPLVDCDAEYQWGSRGHQEAMRRLRDEIDAALDGTIHSFTRNGAMR